MERRPATDISPYLHRARACAHPKCRTEGTGTVGEGGWEGGLSRHLITEMSWADSCADERLPINRLLLSLNSCLSSSLIRARGWQRKIKAANESNISARLLQAPRRRRAALQPLATRGRYSTTHVHVCGDVLEFFVGLTSTSTVCQSRPTGLNALLLPMDTRN